MMMKPGAHLLVSGSCPYHRLAIAVEDAGFELRDCLMWLHETTAGLTPAMMQIVMARKPLEGTVADNVVRYGTGGINIDDCRVEIATDDKVGYWPRDAGDLRIIDREVYGGKMTGGTRSDLGRWPANLLHDGSKQVLAEFDRWGERKAGGVVKGTEPSRTGDNGIYGHWERVPNKPFNDSGTAARFFYNTGSDGLLPYLVRLVTPPNGLVLTDSAQVGAAADDQGFRHRLMVV